MSVCHSEPGPLVLFCCRTTFQRMVGALDRKLWGRLVKSMHFLLSYKYQVSKWLNVSRHQCRYELQLCNQTPSKLLTVALHNSNSERKKVPSHPGFSTTFAFRVHLQETIPYLERQSSSNSFKKVSAQDKKGIWRKIRWLICVTVLSHKWSGRGHKTNYMKYGKI